MKIIVLFLFYLKFIKLWKFKNAMDKIKKTTSILSWREQKTQFSKALFSINSRKLPWKTDLFPRVNFNVFDKSLLERKEKDIEFCFFQDPDQACVSASEMAYPLFLLQLL